MRFGAGVLLVVAACTLGAWQQTGAAAPPSENSRPSANTIVKATGTYAGRTGSVRLSGANDVRQFPTVMVQDDFWVIDLS